MLSNSLSTLARIHMRGAAWVAPMGGALTHGESFQVAGSGFGTKDSSAPTIWDNCSGAAPRDLWSRIAHALENGERWEEDYRTPTDVDIPSPGGPSLPHSNVSQYLCGAHQSGTTGWDADVYVSHSFTRPSYPYYVNLSAYIRNDDRWTFGGDNNHKFFGFSDSGGSIYTGNYFYVEATNTTGFDNTTDPITFNSIDDGTGATGYPNDWQSTAGVDTVLNWTANWIKIQWVIKFSDSSGYGRMYGGAIGDTSPLCHSVTGVTDNYDGTDRAIGIGGYSRERGDNLWRYFSDLYLDVQSANPGRFVLTDNATFDSSTIIEYQPYTAWSATSVTLTCNKGALSSETVHLHYRDEVNGNQYLGTKTMN